MLTSAEIHMKRQRVKRVAIRALPRPLSVSEREQVSCALCSPHDQTYGCSEKRNVMTAVSDQQKTTGGFNISGWYDKRVWDSLIYSPQKRKWETLSPFSASHCEPFGVCLRDFRRMGKKIYQKCWTEQWMRKCLQISDCRRPLDAPERVRACVRAGNAVDFEILLFDSEKIKVGMTDETWDDLWYKVPACVCLLLRRCHLWCGHALPVGMSVEETPGAEGSDPQRPFPDAPARRQRRGLHQLPRQRRLQVSLPSVAVVPVAH